MLKGNKKIWSNLQKIKDQISIYQCSDKIRTAGRRSDVHSGPVGRGVLVRGNIVRSWYALLFSIHYTVLLLTSTVLNLLIPFLRCHSVRHSRHGYDCIGQFMQNILYFTYRYSIPNSFILFPTCVKALRKCENWIKLIKFQRRIITIYILSIYGELNRLRQIQYNFLSNKRLWSKNSVFRDFYIMTFFIPSLTSFDWTRQDKPNGIWIVRLRY